MGSLRWLLQVGSFILSSRFLPLGQALPADTTASQDFRKVLSLALRPLLVTVSRALPHHLD